MYRLQKTIATMAWFKCWPECWERSEIMDYSIYRYIFLNNDKIISGDSMIEAKWYNLN